MIARLLAASALLWTASATAQVAPVQAISGTRLDVVATGEVTRIPDVAVVNTGVVTLAPTASAAIAQNAQQMAAVRAALRRAGVADRDIQTSSLNLHPEYRHTENRQPELTGYRAHNEVSVRFRDIANTGKILDALVSVGANQINGPMLTLDKPQEALDEARTAALANARQRADLYAKAMGKRVARILSVSEAGGMPMPGPAMQRSFDITVTGTRIDPGQQTMSVSLVVSFELQ